MIAVINSSPLIYLGKLGVVDLLPRLFSQVLTNETVREEVPVRTAPEYLVLNECFSSWLEVKTPSDEDLVLSLKEMSIHLGEAKTIALARELMQRDDDVVAIIDDLAARDIATTLNIPITGTVGVILLGAKKNLITPMKAKRTIKRLIEDTKFRISTDLYSKIISEIDEI